MTSKNQGRKLELDIYRISTYHHSNIIGHHRNALLPDEEVYKVSNPGLYMDSKPNLDINHCAKYLFNDQLDINLNTQVLSFHTNTMLHPQPYQRIVSRVNLAGFHASRATYLSSPTYHTSRRITTVSNIKAGCLTAYL